MGSRYAELDEIWIGKGRLGMPVVDRAVVVKEVTVLYHQCFFCLSLEAEASICDSGHETLSWSKVR